MEPTVVRGDRHDMAWTITGVDLTGASVVLALKALVGEAVAQIAGSVNGTTATFPWADQVPPGTYFYEIEVTAAGAVVTAPSDKPGTLTVRTDLNPV